MSSGLFNPYGAEGARTPDLYSAIVALSQLSYSPSAHKGDYTISRLPDKGSQANAQWFARSTGYPVSVSTDAISDREGELAHFWRVDHELDRVLAWW